MASLATELRKAADRLDRERVHALCDEYIRHVHASGRHASTKTAKDILRTLRRKRFVEDMRRVADALVQSGHPDPQVRRQYAQALIEQGALTAARHVLEQLLSELPPRSAEHVEASGLLGRIYKQMFVDAATPDVVRNRDYLLHALALYAGAYLSDPAHRIWHGINAVALAREGLDLQLPIAPLLDPDALAEAILAQLGPPTPALDVWSLGTAVEACVALGRDEEALKWARRYAAHPEADAFELGSTVRQLEQVWGLTADSPVLALLRGALLERERGVLSLDPSELHGPAESALPSGKTLEKVLGKEAYKTLRWYQTGLERAHAVALIGTELDGGLGTGFLVRGKDVAGGKYGEGPLLLTNSHVVWGTHEVRDAVRFDEAVVRFEALGAAPEAGPYTVTKVHAESPPDKLDFALLELEPAAREGKVCPPASRLPVRDGTQRLYLVGHPLGGTLSFSLQDNLFLDHDETFLHYRTPTDPGSSGSPVFNAKWELVGLHHAGSHKLRKLSGPGYHAANEGIRFDAIQKHLATA
jgi:hypothetical protein